MPLPSRTQMQGAIQDRAASAPMKAMIITVQPPLITIPCLFNPAEIRYRHSANWTSSSDSGTEKSAAEQKDVPKKTFSSGDAPSLSMSLFFDTTNTGTDVRVYVDPLISLTYINPLTRLMRETKPPLVKFVWGKFSASLSSAFVAYIPSVSVVYSMFLPDGTPIRAEAEVEFIGYQDLLDLPFQNPTSRSDARSIHVVIEGETIDWIAHHYYGDAAQWRRVADANPMLNPMKLPAGQSLKIPPPVDF